MKALRRSSLIILQKFVLTCRKAELAFFVSFSVRVFLHEYHDSLGIIGKYFSCFIKSKKTSSPNVHAGNIRISSLVHQLQLLLALTFVPLPYPFG